MILNPGSHEVVRSVELGTVDAQEVVWSGDGRWIAVRDAASAGHKVLIYTADGQLFKTWCGEMGSEIGLGVKCLQWNHLTGALTIGDYNDGVTFLRNETVSESEDKCCVTMADQDLVFDSRNPSPCLVNIRPQDKCLGRADQCHEGTKLRDGDSSCEPARFRIAHKVLHNSQARRLSHRIQRRWVDVGY